MGKNQPKMIEMSRHVEDLSGFQPMGRHQVAIILVWMNARLPKLSKKFKIAQFGVCMRMLWN